MKQDTLSLTPSEWHLMECLWEQAPRTGREAVDWLKDKVGWNRSTTLTMLRRMSEKGAVRCEERDGRLCYWPLVRREDAVLRETEDFLQRVYGGSVSLLMSAMTKKQKLSEEEIAELYAILRNAETDGKEDAEC